MSSCSLARMIIHTRRLASWASKAERRRSSGYGERAIARRSADIDAQASAATSRDKLRFRITTVGLMSKALRNLLAYGSTGTPSSRLSAGGQLGGACQRRAKIVVDGLGPRLASGAGS